MVKKEKLLELIRRGHAELQHFADQLSEAERNTIGVGDHWSARDMLTHLIEWKRRSAEYHDAADQGEDVPYIKDINHENSAIVDGYRRMSWDEVQAALDRALQVNLAVVERLSDDELNDPDRYAFLNGRTAWRNLIGNSFMHPLAMHLRPWYIAHGQVDYATRLAEEEARLLCELDPDPQWQGLTTYNLACHYALIGDEQRALNKLAAALQLNPGLTEYSQQDPDFESLYNTPEFLEITGVK